MFAHIAGHCPGVDVKTAPGGSANDGSNGFAFVEIVRKERVVQRKAKADCQQRKSHLHSSNLPNSLHTRNQGLLSMRRSRCLGIDVFAPCPFDSFSLLQEGKRSCTDVQDRPNPKSWRN